MKSRSQVLNTEINSINLMSGQVIAMHRSSDNTHHNMIIFPCGDKLCAIEELFATDKITEGKYTSGNYCYIDRDSYPDTLGIDPVFGDTVCGIYPHMGWCDDENEITEITYYDNNGCLCSRMNW